MNPLDIGSFLAASDRKGYFLDGILENSWIDIWGSREQTTTIESRTSPLNRDVHLVESDVLFCELLPNALAPVELESSSWTMFDDPDCISGYVETTTGRRSRKRYARFGHETGRELLVLRRRFSGMAPERLEIAESFRLWHNLAEERRDDGMTVFVRFDESGDRHDVIRVDSKTNSVQVEKRALLHYLSGRRMTLAVYFACERKADVTYLEAGCATDSWETPFPASSAHMRWVAVTGRYAVAEWPSFTQLTGKRLIVGTGPISSPRNLVKPVPFEEFIVGQNREGNDILATCDPAALANAFGGNAGMPHYLTPVFFRKEVLGRYLEQPSKYTVGDSRIVCGSLWRVMVDNNHDRHVILFLGDIGRDLPQKERQYWRTFNIAPEGAFSDAFARRNLTGEFAETDRPEFQFKYLYERVAREWEVRWGWPLFLPLESADRHVFDALHVPVTEEQREFDEQVLGLCKLLVDSLNEAAIERATEAPSRDGAKGIEKLDSFLRSQSARSEGEIGFLRRLQEVRSSGSAHRKGRRYGKALAALELEGVDRSVALHRLMAKAIGVLNLLDGVVPASAAP